MGVVIPICSGAHIFHSSNCLNGVFANALHSLRIMDSSITENKNCEAGNCGSEQQARAEISNKIELTQNEQEDDEYLMAPTGNFCIICGDSFVSFSELEEHIDKHGGDVPFECPECAALYEDLNLFLDHIVKHASIFGGKSGADQTGSRDIGCCSPSRSLQVVLAQSVVTGAAQCEEDNLSHRLGSPSEQSKSCERINKISTNSNEEYRLNPKAGQRTISKLQIKKSGPFGCRKCGEYIVDEANFPENPKQIRLYESNNCGPNFAPENDHIYHRTHTGENSIKCDVCGVLFGSKRSLISHQQEHKRRRRKCKYCGDEFATETNLS